MTRKHYDHIDMLCLHVKQLEKRLEVLENMLFQLVPMCGQTQTQTQTETQTEIVAHEQEPNTLNTNTQDVPKSDNLLRRRTIV